MSLFHLGQHVKVTRHAEGSTFHVGAVGFVDALDCEADDGTEGMVGVDLGDYGDGWCFFDWQLEPIQKPGDETKIVDIEQIFPGLLSRCRDSVGEAA